MPIIELGVQRHRSHRHIRSQHPISLTRHVVLFRNLLLNRTGAILLRWLDGRRQAALIMLVCDVCRRLLPYYAREVAIVLMRYNAAAFLLLWFLVVK